MINQGAGVHYMRKTIIKAINRHPMAFGKYKKTPQEIVCDILK